MPAMPPLYGTNWASWTNKREAGARIRLTSRSVPTKLGEMGFRTKFARRPIREMLDQRAIVLQLNAEKSPGGPGGMSK